MSDNNTMNSDLTKFIEDCKGRVSRGASREELILYLHDQGLTIVETMRILKETYKLSLGKAKEIVTAHPVWANEVKGADRLHSDLEKALSDDAVDSSAN